MADNTELTFERLVDWVEDRLSPAEAEQVERQVAVADAATQAQVKWLRAFMRLGDTIVLLAPPRQVRTYLTERFADYAEARRQPGFFRRLAAALSFDSALHPASAGVRSGQSDGMRQFVFSTDVADIAVSLQRRPGDTRLDLLGQILPKEDDLALDVFAVQLLREDREVAIVMADELGEFLLESLEPGIYQLLLSTDSFEIDLPFLSVMS
jgi:hypothetical protein